MQVLLDRGLNFPLAFLIGGALCAVAQLLIIRTRLTPARILVIFLIAGIVLEGVGVFGYIKGVGFSGATIPIIGFGAALAND